MLFTPQGTAYRIEGNGPQTLVFAHGVGLNHAVWQPQVQALAGQYSVVSYDLLGHGASPSPKINAQMADYIGQLEELRASLNLGPIAVIGHSMGALIAIGYALAHGDQVTHLAALNAVYCRSEEAQQAAQERAKQVQTHGPQWQIEATLDRWFGDEALTPAQQNKRAMLKTWLTQSDPAGYATTYRLFSGSDRLYEDQLQQLSCPTLFLTGALDPHSTPEMSVAMANEVDTASCAVMPAARHMLPYVNAEQTTLILQDFLLSS